MKKIILIYLYSLLLLAQNSNAALYTRKNFKPQLSVGTDYVCAIDQDQRKCYRLDTGKEDFESGSKRRGSEDIVLMVQQGHDYCTIIKSHAFCGPVKHIYEYEIPKLLNPRQISMGRPGTCALDELGLHCWVQKDRYNSIEVSTPTFKNPRQVSVYSFNNIKDPQYCVLDDDGVHCIGSLFPKRIASEFPQNLIQIAAFDGNVCGISPDRLSCWARPLSNYSSYKFKDYYFPQQRPRQLIMNFNHMCTLDEMGVHCWENFDKKLEVPRLTNPVAIGISGGKVCALAAEGIVCWHFENKEVIRIPDARIGYPTRVNPAFNLDQLHLFLQVASSSSTPVRAQFFAELKKYAEEQKTAEARLLLAELIAPAINSLDTEYAKNTLTPKFQESLNGFRAELKVKNLSMILSNDETQQVALKVILESFKRLKEFNAKDGQGALLNITRAIGQAMTSPSDENIKSLVAELNLQKSFMASSQSNPKSAFLVETILLAKEWLGGK